MKKMIAMGKDKDKGQIFDSYKVRMELIYDSNNANWCVYSNKMFGLKGGLKESDVEELQRW